MNGTYPNQNEIKPEWTFLHKAALASVTLLILGILVYEGNTISLNKLLNVMGLYIDMIGAVIASLKTPYYGIFHDGGLIEVWRQNVERKYFQFGMLLIVFGMILQTFAIITPSN